MRNKLKIIAAVFVLLIQVSFANAQLSVTLNTGYNHATGSAYAVPTTPWVSGTPISASDNYWMHLSNPTSNTWSPAFAIQRYSLWSAPIASPVFTSTWLNSRNTWQSLGTSPTNPGYNIYRKCFCLFPGYVAPQVSLRVRSDNGVTVWLNSMLNTVLAPSPANFNTTPYAATRNTGFRVGSNCIYVLVEDTGTATGFDVNGTVTATSGLLLSPASGPNQSYAPCGCNAAVPPTDFPPVKSETSRELVQDDTDDSEVVKQIVKFAEERIAQRIKEEK